MLLFALYWVGRYAFFLRVLGTLGGGVGVGFFFTAPLDLPGARELVAGLVPLIPRNPAIRCC